MTEKMEKRLLYRPDCEHDACGVGLIVNVKGVKYRDVVERALTVLENMAHRGAEGADSRTGDGAGIMLQIPHEYILLSGIPVPEPGRYGVGMLFAPKDPQKSARLDVLLQEIASDEGLTIINTRKVPVDSTVPGGEALQSEPDVVQVFLTAGDDRHAEVDEYEERLQRALYRLEKRLERRLMAEGLDADASIVSLSTRTIVYKGMLTSGQLRRYYTDLQSPYLTSAFALVHSRFSTNTFPQWRLAQPFRMIAHNGEINTIRGNRLWMQTREAVLRPPLLGDVEQLWPIIQPGMSDSASMDNTVEFFVRGGMPLPHTLAMLMPTADMTPETKHFFEYHSIYMEAWDGPATVLFADGRHAGGMLDRNGLRPCRYCLTDSGMLIMASETGVIDLSEETVVEKGSLRPGQMLMVDLQRGEILRDDRLKAEMAAEHPYRDWMKANRVKLSEIHSGRKVSHEVTDYERKLTAFGHGAEDIDRLLIPMCTKGAEPSYAMGADIPPAVLSQRPRRLFDYFRQQFAQVTNPAIDPLRETSVMSLKSFIGAVKGNVLAPSPDLCKVVELDTPLISDTELDLLKNLRYKGFRTITLDTSFLVADGPRGLKAAIQRLCREGERAVDDGYSYLMLSDKDAGADRAPVPSLIAVSALHHHLIARRKRSQIALIVEAGDALEAMHVALLVGFGASAVNPYMAYATINRLVQEKKIQLDYPSARGYYTQAVNKGLMKIISKMGISTILSYRGAKLFESIGISQQMLDDYFGGGLSPVGGIGIDDLAARVLERHRTAFGPSEAPELKDSGRLQWRKTGERHAWTPSAVKALRAAAMSGKQSDYEAFCREADNTGIFLRDCLDIKSDREPVPVDQVEPADQIIRRFVAEAMSFGALSREAHEDIALALNSVGACSNAGEGGEPAERFTAERDGVSLNSAVKQVASGRFGVTVEYLMSAREIQIKVSQGAKPGEGGQLPGFKVDEMIARTRKSIPGITLISPPPHHDIYSIEDLSQLINDLRCVNPTARISVKLVSEGGVGTVAAGVAKAKADAIVVSGADGGTGASPMSSVMHAGMPWETGLAEVQQTLVLNALRGKVSLQVDGQMKTGRDVVVAALLGAEEFGFGTALLIALGCVMDRKCHTNKCCAGIATQCAEFRKKYKGSPRHVVSYLQQVAEDVRRRLAAMGYTSLADITGRSDLLTPAKAKSQIPNLDFSRMLARVDSDAATRRSGAAPSRPASTPIDDTLISATAFTVGSRVPIAIDLPIANTDRSVGARLSGEITRRLGGDTPLADGTVTVNFHGSAGQSFGAFLCHGVTFNLRGDANDYLGKGLSGGCITAAPKAGAIFNPGDNTIAGNTLLYGATAGEVYICGVAGERFAVRNSGATAVVEGVGSHCCEYMTGGTIVVLGPTGGNFAAGMSGGVAYVLNPDHNFDLYCNMELIELTLVEETADRERLHSLLERHHRLTGSPRAAELLKRWPASLALFIKVTPIEYKRILAEVNDAAE